SRRPVIPLFKPESHSRTQHLGGTVTVSSAKRSCIASSLFVLVGLSALGGCTCSGDHVIRRDLREGVVYRSPKQYLEDRSISGVNTIWIGIRKSEWRPFGNGLARSTNVWVRVSRGILDRLREARRSDVIALMPDE